MTEHIAHLDSPNIDHVAVLMHALADRAQFVLATPANAESLRLSWCDLQLAFLLRDPGRAYSPPIRLLSRLGVGDLEERIRSGSSPVKIWQRRQPACSAYPGTVQNAISVRARSV